MPVTQPYVRELVEVILKDKPLGADFKTRFRRGDASPANLNAARISQHNAVEHYEGKELFVLVDEGISLYKELRLLNVPIDDATMKAHSWLSRYLPILDSEIFTACVSRHQAEYNYLDRSEIYLQVITAIMLAYHSDPALFVSKQDEFQSMVNEWLEALLTLTRMPLAEVQSVPNWNTAFYTTKRNLAFIDLATPQYLRVSQQFAGLLGLPKWQRRVVIFNAIQEMIGFVVEDHQKVSTHELLGAVSQLHALKAHVPEFQAAPQLPPYAPSPSQTQPVTDEEIASAAINVPPVYLTPAQQATQDAGMRLIRQGMDNLHLAMSLASLQNQDDETQNQDDETDPSRNCCLM